MNKLVDMSDALKQVRSGKAPEQEKMHDKYDKPLYQPKDQTAL